MSSLLAKKLGARKVIALIANPAYVDLLQGQDIDVAFAPQQITIGSLLTHVRRGDMAAVHSLRRGAAEALGDRCARRQSHIIGSWPAHRRTESSGGRSLWSYCARQEGYCCTQKCCYRI